MNAERTDPVLCGDACPLVQLGDTELAATAREWAFSSPTAHEDSKDPRYPGVNMIAMHLGSLCRFRYQRGSCEQEPPAATSPSID